MKGYSDAINHAFAFAAKHHDQEVRKGTRLPYLTAAPNVAVILARYGQDEETVVIGIVHEVVEDFVRDGYTAEMLTNRIADKFGERVLMSALSIVERRVDDDGVELAPEERKADVLTRLGDASPSARWVLASETVHAASTLLANLARTDFPESVWSRYAAGREGTIRWFSDTGRRLRAVGFEGSIMTELDEVVSALERYRSAG